MFEDQEGVAFNLNPQEGEGVSFSMDAGMPEKAASIRGEQISIALGGSTSPDEIANSLQYSEDDSTYRQSFALQQEQDLADAQLGMLTDMTTIRSPSFDIESAALQYRDIANVNPTVVVDDMRINVEKGYAEKLFDYSLSATNNNAFRDKPTITDQVLADRAIEQMAFQASLKAKLAEIDYQDTGNPVNDTYEFLSNWIPFVSDARYSNEVTGASTTTWLAGNNMKEQIDYINTLPLPEKVQASEDVINKLLADGLPDQAAVFANALLGGYTERDALMDNLLVSGMSVFDVATLGVGATVGKSAKSAAGYVRGVVRGSAVPNDKVLQNIAEEVADNTNATVSKMLDQVDATKYVPGIEDIRDVAVGATNPSRLLANQTTLSGANLNKVKAALQDGESAIAKIFNTPNIERLSIEEMQVAVEKTSSWLLTRFARESSRILDIGTNLNNTIEVAANPLTNTSTIAVKFGMKNGELFASEEAANAWANKIVKLKTGSFTVEEHGGKFFVQVLQDVDESKGFAKGLKPIPTNNFNEGFINKSLRAGWLRSVGDVLPQSNMEARGAALHGGQRILEMFKEVTNPITKITRKEDRRNFMSMLEMQRDGYHPVTKRRGFYFDNVDDFSNAYIQKYGESPSPDMIAANFAYRQANDAEYFIRNIGRYRDIVRVGGKQLNIRFRDPKTNKMTEVGGLGKPVENIDFANGDFRIATIDPKGNVQVKNSRSGINSISKSDIDKMLAEGYEIYKTIENPFKFGKSRAHYVMSKAGVQVDRVSLKSLDYNSGGHVINKYSFYVKQARTTGDKLKFYLGDRTLMNAFTLKQANELTEIMERARKSFAAGTDDWKKIVDEEMPWTDRASFEDMFKEFDVNVPFIGTKAGARSLDHYPQGALGDLAPEAQNNLNELAFLDRNFSQARDDVNAWTLREEEAGKYILDDADLIDPVESLSVGVRSAISNSLQKDYVTKSVTQMLNNFSDIIAMNKNEVFSNPLKFLHGESGLYLKGADAGRVAVAEAARKAILRQVGDATVESGFLDSVKTKIAESMLPGSERFVRVHNSLLPLVKDPFVFARNIAFDLKLGLFNFLQIPVQAQTLTHLIALSPQHSFPAITAAWAMQGLRLSGENNFKKMAKHFGKGIAKVHSGKGGFGRMSTEEFEESYGALRKSGWDLVGSDMAHLDDAMNPELFERKGRKFLHAGRVFFNGIERHLRLAAWNAAYLEWKGTNKGAALTDGAIAAVMRRADDLSVNMSSMNNAVWQKGIAGVPLQFASYQIRLMEQLLPSLIGKGRIPAKQARIAIGVYSAMYGVGYGGISSAIGGLWPAGDALREAAAERGLNVQDEWYEFIFDGVPSVLNEMLTGYDLDWSDRYAPGGFDLVKDLWEGETSPLELGLGASGSVLGNVYEAGYNGFMTAYHSAFNVENDEGMYRVLASDLADVVREASSINAVYGAYAAWNTGKWYTRRGKEVADVDPLEGVVAKILGATPTSINMAYVKNNILRGEKEFRNAAAKSAKNYYSRAMNALKAGNIQEYNQFFRRAKAELIAAGYNNIDAHKVLRRAMTEMPFEKKVADDWAKDAAKYGERGSRD